MKVYDQTVAGSHVKINVVETEDDLAGFRSFIRSNLRLLAVDSETTGLDIYGDKFACRLVQFGTSTDSFVVPVEFGGTFLTHAKQALLGAEKLVIHNAAYDLQVFERTLAVPMEKLWPKTIDTRILAHLNDPRGKDEGGTGQSLEDLTRAYIDQAVADNVKTLMADLAKAHKTTKANVWKKVPLTDPHYELYSGMDPILTARLLVKYYPELNLNPTLIRYEHELAAVCSYIERTGFLLDVEYTEKLRDELKFTESVNKETALKYGVDMVNSTEQVADALEAFGVKIKARTPTGKRKVDDALLSNLTTTGDNHLQEFARAVIEAKKASKWRKTWVENFLAQRDGNSRCHAAINPLRARTARMSITGIPAQTLPASDSLIRRCFLADEGHRIASVDYQAQELRVLAALSRDETMIQAFKDGADLHLMTAQAAFGPDVTKDGKERKWAKVVNFGRVYGGGAKTVAEQTGLDFLTAKRVVDGFDRAYPGVQRLSAKLQKDAVRDGYVTTTTGRRLPVDEDRAYSALNYLVQSTSRDVTGAALLRLHQAGFTPYVRLPIHDEVLCSLPADRAEWGAQRIAEIMAQPMGEVHVGTDPEVGGRSWGSLYGSEV